MTPYQYTYQNPIKYTDPTGMEGESADDWIKNNKTGKYEWKNEVTSKSNTPSGYSYIGKEDRDIVNDLFGDTYFSKSTWDIGLISADDFDNSYSAKGAAAYNMKANTTMGVSISPLVNTQYDNQGNIKSKEFLGVNIDVAITGKTFAPYPDMNLFLVPNKMTLQGNNMKRNIPTGEYIIPGGDVPTILYRNSWEAKSIQSNFIKSYNLDFKFKGQYFNEGGGGLGIIGLGGALIPNYTNLNISIPFKNFTRSNK